MGFAERVVSAKVDSNKGPALPNGTTWVPLPHWSLWPKKVSYVLIRASVGEPWGGGVTLLHGERGKRRKRCLCIEHQGFSVPIGGLSGSRLSPAQGSGPGVGRDPD